MDEITHRKIRNAITTAPKLGLTWRDLYSNQNINETTLMDPDKLKILVLDFLKVRIRKRRNFFSFLQFLFFYPQSWCLEERLRRCSVTFCIPLRGIIFRKFCKMPVGGGG